jgi:pimeloyl-ACP methyl ester carboxylesterase
VRLDSVLLGCQPERLPTVRGLAAMKATARPRADQTITLADGRTLAFSEWGSPTGHPVMLVHGGPGSRLLCPDEDATAAAGVRLLTADRPGYGGSDARPDPTLLGWADDVQALADRLGLERFAVVGFSAGGGYALACAASMPKRISAVGLACCEGPYDEVPGAWQQGMTPEERTLFELIRRDPIAARGAVAAHVGWYQDPDTIWESEPPAVDVAILARSDVRDALTRMSREGARQGVEGLVDDWIALSLPWGFAFADVKVPVSVWHGELDHLVEPAHPHYLSAVLPNSTLVLYPEDGHLLLLQHWSEILAAVTAAGETKDSAAERHEHGGRPAPQ